MGPRISKKTKNKIEKEDALNEYENMGGKRYSRKILRKEEGKLKKIKKRKLKDDKEKVKKSLENAN